MTQPPMSSVYSDDFQTPPSALNPLLPYLKSNWVIWECACGKGNLSRALEARGYSVIATDILNGHDFLKWSPDPEKYDCIVTNPPYSLKQEFLERCYKLKKRFALLLPLTVFETEKRQKLFKGHGVQVIFLKKRVNFETPSGKGSGSWFAVAWFTNWLNLPNDLVWEEDKAQKRLVI